MRKILLGTTAVVGAALLAQTASAQEAPTVRIGGYFQAYYGHTTQSNPNSFNAQINQPANISVGAGATGATTSPQNNTASTKTGKNDFSADAEIHIFVNGKAANGLSYGAVLELAFDGNEGSAPASSRRTFTYKTSAWMDEMYAFISSPTLGQIRFGDEDGPVGGLMNVGVVTNFGTGGVYGFWQNFVVRPNRTTTSPGDLGDNTKIIYLSPQFAGFDFGISYALNSGTGQDNGCASSFASPTCDRAYAFSGATANGIQSYTDQPQRRNELQMMLRWRGEVAGVGLAVSAGHVSWAAIRDITQSGAITTKTLRPGNVWLGGVQATYLGITVGGNFQGGQSNFFWGSQARGDQSMSQFMVGASYTAGPFTVGANAFWGLYSGSQGFAYNTITGAYTRNNNASNAGQRRSSYSVGANYRLAPGLDLVAEYVRHQVHEPGNNLLGGTGNGAQDKIRADVIMIGTRLAF
jgi:hypothetical protein